ncbi:hypothetical protein F444_07681 [Phytophthora nicotianae P1976]|uniref:Uncharacterized protein n=1 Tax=Phytophthora nicotianae P1976 TaxID=1317066 RepID=A0A081ADV8_PHYNI|nr:hypothetical protein F444_07681 [Phytophthora nicotianae P1976]
MIVNGFYHKAHDEPGNVDTDMTPTWVCRNPLIEDTSKFFNAHPAAPVPCENTEEKDGQPTEEKNIDTRAGKDLVEDLKAWTSKHFDEDDIPPSELPW